MNPFARKVYYLAGMPFLFLINVMLNFWLFNTTWIIVGILVIVMILRISDRGKHFVKLNEWVKRKTCFYFTEIYETGVMPNSRTLLIVIPCIVTIPLNIAISNLVR